MLIRVIYDEILRQKTDEVTVFDDKLVELGNKMLTIMKRSNGVGLAGNQVGRRERICVYGYQPKSKDDLPAIPDTILINPKIISQSNRMLEGVEGCLSIPYLELPVYRSESVVVSANRPDGKKITIKAKGFLARVLQHEIDHLDGKLFTDRVIKNELMRLANYRFARIVFFGSDKFSCPVLQWLIDNQLTVIAVITEIDKPSGRGRIITPNPLAKLAQSLSLNTFKPTSKSEITSVIKELKPDLIILAAYGKILPPETLAAPTFGALNLHASLLPKFRGATPISSAILAGEKATGVSIIQMDEKIDTGRIVAMSEMPILNDDTTGSLKEKLSHLSIKLLEENLPLYLSGQTKLLNQNSNLATHTAKITSDTPLIDWAMPLEQIDRQIRAYSPSPGAYTYINGKRLKILSSYFQNDRLYLNQVQLEGKKPVNWPEFVNGYKKQLSITNWFDKIS